MQAFLWRALTYYFCTIDRVGEQQGHFNPWERSAECDSKADSKGTSLNTQVVSGTSWMKARDLQSGPQKGRLEVRLRNHISLRFGNSSHGQAAACARWPCAVSSALWLPGTSGCGLVIGACLGTAHSSAALVLRWAPKVRALAHIHSLSGKQRPSLQPPAELPERTGSRVTSCAVCTDALLLQSCH